MPQANKVHEINERGRLVSVRQPIEVPHSRRYKLLLAASSVILLCISIIWLQLAFADTDVKFQKLEKQEEIITILQLCNASIFAIFGLASLLNLIIIFFNGNAVEITKEQLRCRQGFGWWKSVPIKQEETVRYERTGKTCVLSTSAGKTLKIKEILVETKAWEEVLSADESKNGAAIVKNNIGVPMSYMYISAAAVIVLVVAILYLWVSQKPNMNNGATSYKEEGGNKPGATITGVKISTNLNDKVIIDNLGEKVHRHIERWEIDALMDNLSKIYCAKGDSCNPEKYVDNRGWGLLYWCIVKGVNPEVIDHVYDVTSQKLDYYDLERGNHMLDQLYHYDMVEKLERWLVKSAISGNVKLDIHGSTFTYAAKHGLKSAIKEMTEKYTRNDLSEVLNIKDLSNMAPIHYAAYIGDEELIKIIVKSGANIHLPGPQGRSSGHIAIQALKDKSAPIIIVLKQAGFDFGCVDNFNNSVRMYAIQNEIDIDTLTP